MLNYGSGRANGVVVACMAAGALMAVAAGLTYMLPTPSGWKGEENPKVASRDPITDPGDDRPLVSLFAAQLTQAVDCEWPNKKELGEGSNIYRGQTVDLRRGLAKITFNSGATVILDGPVKFKVISPEKGYLHSGKLTANVPDDVQEFTIDTPVAKIVDAEYDRKVIKEGESIRIDGPNTKQPPKEGGSIRLEEGESIRIE